MALRTSAALILFLLVCVGNLLCYAYIPKIINGRPTGGFLKGFLFHRQLPHSIQDPVTNELWFDQKLDHFDPSDTRTWKQRYFINKSYFKPGGPIFLMIGGEGTADPIWMSTGDWVENAKKYNAFCIQVEHRFYGKSHPTEDMSTENLKYLSSMQALADLANFRQNISPQFGFTKNKWISFGGSYPGALSAWFRLKYPQLVDGAVASSAPVNAVLNFKDYLRVVTESLATFGGPECNTAISQATEAIEQLLKTPAGRNLLKTNFNLCQEIDISNTLDISNLFSSFSGNFEGVVQYNRDNREFEHVKGTNITITTLCNIMTNKNYGPPIDRYARVNQLMLKTQEEECLDFSYKEMIKDLRETSWNSSAAEGGRQWIYQTCTEFGYFQTSDFPKQPFGHYYPLSISGQICMDLFGKKFNLNLTSAGIQWTNANYGALHLSGSRIILPNGSIDPWHALGVLSDISKDVKAVYINGTAHCANMYPAAASDPLALVLARQEISEFVGKWLL
ncbi:putative serine protease K12H4.7 [Octopus sinensis]|uniref:Serine protease K12H4.7 n=1 Tax=Octopus sinensis TaxID=2607531 RepID=A0A6P7S750_9MOLL|nr:putative serine protease K12H4.7 [Octopus sinensis]